MDRIRDLDFSTEWFFRTSRSSGKGGQNVNKLSTKVELYFNVEKSYLLNSQEKELIKSRLGKRISSSGLLRISSEKERSQFANKKNVIEKFYRLIENALDIPEEEFQQNPPGPQLKEEKTIRQKLLKKSSAEKSNPKKNNPCHMHNIEEATNSRMKY